MSEADQRMNIQVLAQSVREVEKLVREVKIMVDNLSREGGDLKMRVSVLEVERDQRRIEQMGTGPTAR